MKMRKTLPPATAVLPKSVSSVREGVASPSVMETAFPFTSISGATVPVPWMLKLYGFSSLSLLVMLSSAVRTPEALGLNTTVNVVDPDGVTGLVG